MTTFSRFAWLLGLLVAVSLNGCSWAKRKSSRTGRCQAVDKERLWEKTAQSYGPHICVHERVTGTNRKFSKPWTGGKICGQPTVIVFECCEGYELMPKEPGCSTVRPLVDVTETLSRTDKSARLVNWFRAIRLIETLATDGPYTVFAPINEAFETLTEEAALLLNRTVHRLAPSPSTLLYHIVEGRISHTEFKDNLLLKSLYKGVPLRINKNSNGLLTANCVPLVHMNQEATNGIIHSVESILSPPQLATIADIVVREPQFSRLATMLVKAKLTSVLREQRSFTVFAPSNEAFNKLSQQDFEAIFADVDTLSVVLQYHIVQGVVCSTSITSNSTLLSMEGSSLNIGCDDGNKTVDGAQLLQTDIMATNGFIHITDNVLLPRKARSLFHLLEDLHLFELQELVKKAGLHNMFLNGAKFTLFAPSDKVISALPNETLSALRSNSTAAYNFLVGHMVTGKYQARHFSDKQALPTLAQMRPLQITLAPQRTLVNGALLTDTNHESRNGIVHVIDKVLQPPTVSVGQFLRDHLNMTMFIRMLSATSSRLLSELENGRGPYTVFAPTEAAFQKLPFFTIERILGDSEIVTNVMTNHVLDSQIFTNSLLPKAYYRYQTRHGKEFLVREDTGIVTAAIAIVTERDHHCTNGVVHLIDRIIQF